MLKITMHHIFSAFLVLAVFFAAISNASAQSTVDPAYANMQRAVGGIVNQHVAANGYASSDPRTYQTLRAMGTAAVSGVAAAGAGVLIAGSSIAWGSVLAIAVVGSVISYGVSLGLDQLTKWIFSSNGVTPVIAPITTTNQLLNGSVAVCTNFTGSGTCATSQADLLAYLANKVCGTDSKCGPVPTCNGAQVICIGITNYDNLGQPIYTTLFTSGASSGVYTGPTCPVGQIFASPSCVPLITNTTATKIPLATAVSGLSPQALAQPVDYASMALMINKLWKDAAAQSGYQGIPYDATNPVTSTEVQRFAQANPASYPTVAALTAPIGGAGSAAVTSGLAPSTTISPTAPVTPAVPVNPPTTTVIAPPAPTTDLGVDPNIRFVPPVAPTAQSILDPILNMLPGWRTATFTQDGTCPKPTFNFAPFMNLTVTMESHCNLLEQNRALISSIMAGVWLLIAALIVLSA